MTEQQLLRQAKRRLAILQHAEEVTRNVARTCRYYGISRICFYEWQRRYEEHGLHGLRDRSSRPAHGPHVLAHAIRLVRSVVRNEHHIAGLHAETSTSEAHASKLTHQNDSAATALTPSTTSARSAERNEDVAQDANVWNDEAKRRTGDTAFCRVRIDASSQSSAEPQEIGR